MKDKNNLVLKHIKDILETRADKKKVKYFENDILDYLNDKWRKFFRQNVSVKIIDKIFEITKNNNKSNCIRMKKKYWEVFELSNPIFDATNNMKDFNYPWNTSISKNKDGTETLIFDFQFPSEPNVKFEPIWKNISGELTMNFDFEKIEIPERENFTNISENQFVKNQTLKINFGEIEEISHLVGGKMKKHSKKYENGNFSIECIFELQAEEEL